MNVACYDLRVEWYHLSNPIFDSIGNPSLHTCFHLNSPSILYFPSPTHQSHASNPHPTNHHTRLLSPYSTLPRLGLHLPSRPRRHSRRRPKHSPPIPISPKTTTHDMEVRRTNGGERLPLLSPLPQKIIISPLPSCNPTDTISQYVESHTPSTSTQPGLPSTI